MMMVAQVVLVEEEVVVDLISFLETRETSETRIQSIDLFQLQEDHYHYHYPYRRGLSHLIQYPLHHSSTPES